MNTRFVVRQLLVLASLLPLASCGSEISRETLVGTWAGDFEASWALSEDAFLADTLRGAAAYPDDPAEKARIVREEMKPVIEGMRHTYAADGKLTKVVMGRTLEGDYEITEAAPPWFTLRETAGRAMGVTVEFDDPSTLRWIPEKGPTLVLKKQ